jgi:hypothetical protein
VTLVKTLYHPTFEPPQNWLRGMLLFYDTVHTIVPEAAEYTPSPGIAALKNRVRDAFVPLGPTKQDLEWDWQDLHALRGVLRELAGEGEAGERTIAHRDRSEGLPRLDLGGAVRVHTDKMADELAHDLVELGLAQEMQDPHSLLVDHRVAGLVLSTLAARMARNHPGLIYTSTDRETAFAVTAKSKLLHGEPWNLEATLASAILTTEIPADIADLPLNRYLEIRKRYEDSRELFRLALKELQSLYLEQSFAKPAEFHAELESVVMRFGRGIQTLREQRQRRQVQRWASIALGGIVSLATAALADPTLAVSGAGVTLTLQVLQTAQGERVRGTNIAEAQALLVTLGRDVRWNRRWLGRVLSP